MPKYLFCVRFFLLKGFGFGFGFGTFSLHQVTKSCHVYMCVLEPCTYFLLNTFFTLLPPDRLISTL